MKTIQEVIREAESRKVAVGHFNISDIVALRAISEAAGEIGVPVIIGTSEGEGDFMGREQVVALIRSLREDGLDIFLNSDHTHSLEKAEEAARDGYDAVLFDGGKLPFEENKARTREAVSRIKSINPEIIVEGEIGYIGSSSELLKSLPEGAAVRKEDFTTPEQAREFIKATGVDLLAPAVGNIHGMLMGAKEPALDIERIREIRKAAGVPLVLHGGSGLSDEDFLAAIDAGVSVIHINNEIRVAWRHGLEKGLGKKLGEVAPYKILPEALQEIKEIVRKRLRLFNKISS